MRRAVILRTGKIIYSSDSHSFKRETDCWFSNPDGNSYECSFVMDNREFKERVLKQEIKLLDETTTNI